MSNMEPSHSSMARDASQANCIDPLDSLLDFTDYDNMNYTSPSVSPTDSKNMFVQPDLPTSRANSILPSQQTLSGPSHPYDMHKQQTGLPTGGLASTMAINSNQRMYAGYGYLSGVSPEADFIVDTPKFASNPSSGSFESMNMVDYEAPADASFFFPPLVGTNATQEFVKPANLVASNNATPPQQQQQPGRIWPGMHQQQAMAKAQQQVQQRSMQQQRQNSIANPPPYQKSRSRPPTDPIVEEKISQLLHSMRQNSMATTANDDDDDMQHGNGHHGRSMKDEEDMDEDERLLASEEGKKLSSKERRQLRNKVSARAFRSRRKEYIGQLEGEIARKVNENTRLSTENRALSEENNRLTDLTRLLLGSSAFSSFLNELSTNPTVIPQQQAQRQQPTPPSHEQTQRQPESRQQQARKDVNPYLAQQQAQQQQNQNQDMDINFAILPEQPLDFSMLDLTNQDYMFQPQVFSVHSVPDFTFDSSTLSGKASHETFVEKEEKESISVFAPPKHTDVVNEKVELVDEEFDTNPQFELFAASSTPTPSKPNPIGAPLDIETIVANIKPAKALLNFELVHEQETHAAVSRVNRICASLDAVTTRLQNMSCQ